MWFSSQSTASLTQSPKGILGMGLHPLVLSAVLAVVLSAGTGPGAAPLGAEEADEPRPRDDAHEAPLLVGDGDRVREAGAARAEVHEAGAGRGGLAGAVGLVAAQVRVHDGARRQHPRTVDVLGEGGDVVVGGPHEDVLGGAG